jgi:hypothetical protein
VAESWPAEEGVIVDGVRHTPLRNPPMKIRQERLGHAPGSNITLAIYTHAVGEDDRLLAEQWGEMLCPNVAKLAQEKTFAGSEGVVIQ